MTTKKKNEVVYTPLNNVSQIPQIIEKKVEQVPAYEDSGVKYQSKFKTQQTSNTYELRAQETRFYVFGLQNTGIVFDFTFPRARPDLKFFCTRMVVNFYGMSTFGVSNYIQLADYKAGTYTPRYYFYPTTTSGALVLDFTDCPRKFEGTDFAIRLLASLGAAEFIAFSLFGWEEQQ